MLITNVEIDGVLSQLRVRDGLIVEFSDSIVVNDDDQVIDGRGGALLPGLHDHHIHLNASAVALKSVRCGPPFVYNNESLVAALNEGRGNDWRRGIGYHSSVAGDIDRFWLDQNGPNRPIRIQHRGGRMWVFNSRAMALLDLDIPENGQLIDGDAELRTALPTGRPDLGRLIQKLHSMGVTGVTEVTPGNDQSDLHHYSQYGDQLNLCIMGSDALHGIEKMGGVQVGPLKIHNHDYDLPPLEELTHDIAEAHDANRAVAIHCVTRAELMLSLAAIEDAGVHPGDRIEHGAIVDGASIEWIASLGLTVVTQPHFLNERTHAYLTEVEKHDHANLWRLGSLLKAGIKLAGGSDAPFGDDSPWISMAAATKRSSDFGFHEEITAEQALALYTKPLTDAGAEPRKVSVGSPADLCLLDRSWFEARGGLENVEVAATWVGGKLVHDTISSTSPQSSAV